MRRICPSLPDRLRTVGPYQEAEARLLGKERLDLATRWLNQLWIGRQRMDNALAESMLPSRPDIPPRRRQG